MRISSRSTIVFLSLFAASTTAAFGTVLCVKPVPSGSGCWAAAYTDLQQALAAAGSGDEIWVATGTYKPTATDDRNISFALKNGVGVYGGFNGTETARAQANPAVNVTALSGNIGDPGASNDNSYHVVTAANAVTSTGVLDGFTIAGGQADGAPADNKDRGAGMWDDGGSPTLSRLSFTGNFALAEGGGLGIASGSPILLACVFQGNSVGFGGKGGGIYAGSGSSVTAQGCVFRSNSISAATMGAGGLETAGAPVTLVNCLFAQNSPNGLQVSAADGSVVDNCTFTANTGYGAAFLTSNGNALTNNIFWADTTGELSLVTGSVSASYCDIQGGGFVGSGNINADPLFLAPPTDLRPGPASPVVDAGNNASVPGGVILDLARLPRFFDDPDVPNTGAGLSPPYVDMGAFERIPIAVTSPSSLALCAGTSAVFTVTATGQPTLTYQWRKGGSNLANGGSISGVTTSTLTINPTVTGDAGSYDVVVTDGFGQILMSPAASLTVNARPTAVASGTASLCVGDSTPLSGSGGVSCSWTPSTGLSDASSCAPMAAPTTTTVYTLTVMGPNGCPSTNAPTVAVTASPKPVLPVIAAPASLPVGGSGASASVTYHVGSAYAWTLSGGTILAGQTTHQIGFDAGPPGTTMQCTVIETNNGCSSPPASKKIQVDFLDVPPANGFHNFINTIARNGITAGCTPGYYCPTAPVTRAQMAVFLLTSRFGSGHVPPTPTGIFGDVSISDPFAPWIEELYTVGITGGCSKSPLLYCPTQPVTRAEMAVFLLVAKNPPGYVPPACSGIFADVPCKPTKAFAVDWIERLYLDGITGGCNPSLLQYCPAQASTRGQMAVFLVTTFGLQ